MRLHWPRFYFPWLQKNNPTGKVQQLPRLQNTYETSVPGLFCAGDLTGIPLIKLASESGYDLVNRLLEDDAYQRQREARTDDDIYDLLIIGGGPAGVSACLRAAEKGLNHIVLESTQMFNTIKNFPTGKPIYVTPEGPMESDLTFSDGDKESLLKELKEDVAGKPLPLEKGITVRSVTKQNDVFTVETESDAYRALRVIVAIGATGNPRSLDVPGEDQEKVFTRLIDPTHHEHEDVLVVGGGDSAVEAAVALADAGNRVTLSYRRDSLSRPKPKNIAAFEERVADGTIEPIWESEVKRIGEDDVTLTLSDGEKTIPNDAVYGLIGSELPTTFFKRSGIAMEGERNLHWWLGLVASISFFVMMYFGKSGRAINIFAGRDSFIAQCIAFLTVPLHVGLDWRLNDNSWFASLNFLIGWGGCLIFVIAGLTLLISVWRQREQLLAKPWAIFKYTYFLGVGLLFLVIYVDNQLTRNAGWVEAPTFWYSLLYTLTILIFGLRRMIVRPTGYIIAQTSVLISIQTFFLFLLPFVLYDSVVAAALPDGLREQLFPSGKWSSFAFILFWPLNINEFGNSAFWTWFPFLQTFGILFLIVYLWGKGAYCGWICSCGAMAETLGDEYRTHSPHGPTAKRLENTGQVILWTIIVATMLYVPYKLSTKIDPELGIPVASSTLWYIYKLGIDVFFAGVLGLGVYFFLGGRIWCRYGCPLAALMHIYARFSPYRIMANKNRCISCQVCTKVCHMGIDVMNYANKGIPMNDVECVRCSACIVNCPLQVLTFGSVGRADPDNVRYKKQQFPLQPGWRSGLPKDDISHLIEDEMHDDA